MLRRLLFRDWILNRKALLSNFGLFVAFQIYAVLRVDASREWLVFAAGMAALLAVVAFVKEDSSKAIAWSCTLPVTRGELVRARLVSAWVFVLAGLTAALLLAAAMPGSIVDLAIVFEPSTLLIGATVITVIIALMQPFTIRFGMLGVMIFLVGIQILGVLALTLGAWAQRQGGGTGRPIKDGLAQVAAGLAGIREALSPNLFVVLVVVILVLVNWLGFRFSVFLFRRREF